MKLHTGDSVLIISGKDRGKTGAVLRVFPAEHRVIVTSINMRKRHIKKTSEQAGRTVTYEASIAVSNVMLLDPKTKKPTRVGYMMENGMKKRVSRVSNVVIEKGKVTKPAKVEKKKEEAKPAVSEKEVLQKTEAVPAPAKQKKQPFWKKMGFGAAALKEEAEVEEPTHMQQDKAVPAENIHVRKGGARGS